MQRQDQDRVFGDADIFGRHLDSLAADGFHFVEQRPRIDNDAVADDRELLRPDDAGRQQVQLVRGAVDDQGVPGVVAALEANHHIGPFGQPIDDLALSFVAPLRPDDNYVGHNGLTLFLFADFLDLAAVQQVAAC